MTGIVYSLNAVQMNTAMPKYVLDNLANRVKTAIAAGDHSNMEDRAKELEGSAIPPSHQSLAWCNSGRMQRRTQVQSTPGYD